MTEKSVVIIGAGPAGLTAALELLRRGRHRVTVLEATGDIGGLSKTVNYKGNRIDIGGHRFFSKSDWVMNWWQEILPIQADSEETSFDITYQSKSRTIKVPEASGRLADNDNVMLVRNRLSRIYHKGHFFPYPLKPSLDVALKLGPPQIARILGSYAYARLRPQNPEDSLERFLINRFGRQLYLTFFKGYTEKVWGVPCSEISAEWGAQRIKGLSISGALAHAIKSPLRSIGLIKDNASHTSLIERFLYPKYGPGQMWEAVATKVEQLGGKVLLSHQAVQLAHQGNRITGVTTRNAQSGESQIIRPDHVISSMPVDELIRALSPPAPPDVQRVAAGLQFRDFITVGILLSRSLLSAGGAGNPAFINVPDNWIYIQDDSVRVGRLQFFNNWSPHMVKNEDTAWIGMEYFCAQGDQLWNMPDSALSALAINELQKLGFAQSEHLLDSTVIRMPKAYPGYFGTYSEFPRIRQYLGDFTNLFPIGRNGMHRYNNQDHSMLTARHAVEAVIGERHNKVALWAVNIGDDYIETQSAPAR